MLKSRLAGKKDALLSREIWLQLRKKWRVYGLWKKGEAIQEDHQVVVRLCRKKIRKSKPKYKLISLVLLKATNILAMK